MNYRKQQNFHLSLKKKLVKNRDAESCKENNSSAANKNLDVYDGRNTRFDDFENIFPSSQNFKLRLSEESGEKLPSYDPKYRNTRNQSQCNNTTVSISDSNQSSSNDNSPLKNKHEKKSSKIYPTPYYQDRPIATIVIESSGSEEEAGFKADKPYGGLISLDSDDDSVLNALRIDKKDPFDEFKRSRDYSERDKIRFSRRSAASKSSGSSSSTHFSPAGSVLSRNKVISETSSSEEANKDLEMSGEAAKSCRYKSKLTSSDKSSRKSLSSNDSNPRTSNFGNVTSRSTTKPYDPVKLTKKDAERIFKGVKAGGNSHWTPKLTPTFSNLDSESLSNYPRHLNPATVIDETKSQISTTESNSEDEIISDSSADLKPTKTHVSRFMTNTPNQEKRCYESLSERKKNDISSWLMNNTPGSSSSSSIISESNVNSSFGNSSLERFELKHETPNNRGKISRPVTEEKVESVPRGIERFIYKGKTSVVKNQTPQRIENLEEKRKVDEPAPRKKSLPRVKTVENIPIEDCADILDNLYGDVWRNKADAVFTPKTEPRLNKILTDKERSKTERKQTTKPRKEKKEIFSSSDDDDFDLFSKDIKPNFNSTKKKAVRDSFINDKSASENSSESFYHTALTNPRESKNFGRRVEPKTVSATTKKAIEICDSDSDDDNYPPVKISNEDANRKRLSFSEDESDTSTSEFDPGELVLPKPKARKAPAKTVRHLPKASENFGASKSKSFLASLSSTVPNQNCHPEARVYRDNYKNNKEQLCKYLFQLYNKNIFDGKLPKDMSIEWNVRMRGTAGFCYNRKSIKALGGIVRSSRIVLATKILDTPDRLRDTLVHEMCHAAAWLINNVSDGHGPFWKGWASKAIKTFPELPPIKRCHDYKIKTKFTYRCTKCGYSIGRHSKSLNTESKRCGHCYGKFELLINRTTRSGTTQVATPVQPRTPTGFALFVKENYHSVKNDRRSMKHGEVMKILGQQFAAVKIGKKVH